jgi:hypothetical protein
MALSYTSTPLLAKKDVQSEPGVGKLESDLYMSSAHYKLAD